MVDVLTNKTNGSVCKTALDSTGMIATGRFTAKIVRPLHPGRVLVVDWISKVVYCAQWADPTTITADTIIKVHAVATAPVHVFEDGDRVRRSVGDFGNPVAAAVIENAVDSGPFVGAFSVDPRGPWIGAFVPEVSGQGIRDERIGYGITIFPATPDVTETTDIVRHCASRVPVPAVTVHRTGGNAIHFFDLSR